MVYVVDRAKRSEIDLHASVASDDARSPERKKEEECERSLRSSFEEPASKSAVPTVFRRRKLYGEPTEYFYGSQTNDCVETPSLNKVSKVSAANLSSRCNRLRPFRSNRGPTWRTA